MNYYVYPLRFLGPVHFGDTANGGSLEKVGLQYSADSFYSAFCNELGSDKAQIERFRELFHSKQLVFSSLFPYYWEDDGQGEMEFFLPRPIKPQGKPVTITGFKETKKKATELKKLKKVTYYRASVLCDATGKVANKDASALVMPNFGLSMTVERINRRSEKGGPYFVGSYVFAPNAGLYFIVGFASNEIKDEFDQWLKLLSLSGLGGKRSSGYGKFEMADDEFEVYDDEFAYADIRAISHLLTRSDATCYMNISPIIPQEDELDIVKDGYYTLKKRGGFVQSHGPVDTVKRNTCYVIAEGSCFTKPLQGRVLQIEAKGIPHEVERNGIGLFVGVDYE